MELKVYLDTSVFSALFDERVLYRQSVSEEFRALRNLRSMTFHLSFVFMALCFSVVTSHAENKAGLFPVIEPSRGISGVELGMSIQKALPLFGSLKPVASGVDDQYEGQVVYYYYFLGKDKDNNYGLEIYTDKKKKIFMFVINSPAFITKQGIKVGSKDMELQKVFGEKLKKKKQGDIYIKYSLGGKKGTDFYVKGGVVTQIIVRDY